MQAPFVCLVVAHGWNIIEDFPAAVHWCGRWWVQTRCWVLGEQAPAVDSSWMSRWWVCGCLLGRSWSCVLLWVRSEEHTSELQSRFDLVCRLLLEKKNT